MALNEMAAPATAQPARTATEAPAPSATAMLPGEPSPHVSAPEEVAQPADGPNEPGSILFADEDNTVRFAAAPESRPDGGEPTLLDLFDEWFTTKSDGVVRQGALQIVDRSLARSFLRNADTTRSTRRILAGTIGPRRMCDMTPADWQGFVNLLVRIPKNHGKSSKDRDSTYEALIARADARDAASTRAARARRAPGGWTRFRHGPSWRRPRSPACQPAPSSVIR